MTGNFIVVHAALARKADVVATGCFDESIRACEDYDLWMRMAGRGRNFVYTDGVMARYRNTPGSLSSDRIILIMGGISILSKNITEFGLNDKGEKISARCYLATLYTEIGEIYCSGGHPIKSIAHCFRAVILAPRQWRSISKIILDILHLKKQVYFIKDLAKYGEKK